MADEIVRLSVGVIGSSTAISELRTLDELVQKLNNTKVNIQIGGNSTSTLEKRAEALKQLSTSVQELSSKSGKINISTTGVDKLAKSTTDAGNAASEASGKTDKFSESAKKLGDSANSAGQTVSNMVGKFAQWYIIGELVSAPIAAFKEAVQELKNVDAELVNIQKVMGASAAEMDRLSEKAYQVGSDLGVAASDYLASVTQWAQAGYGSLSDDLGELSVMTQKVGDVDQATANQFLLSVDAAYQYQGSIESLMRVLDGANELSNNFATSVQKLAGGMGIVSSLAAQAGMAVEETAAAIGTITSVTQESGNSAARALRALILNIQGETELEIDEATGERWTEEEINKTAQAINNLNVATREYKDGVLQLRNPMEVIGEISEKYRQGLISEVQLQELVSSLGGKTRSNQLQALITNFDMYEEQVETFVNATGSADRELDVYLNSWEAKANRVANGWVQLVENMKTSEISKGLLDIANTLLTIANSDLGQTIVQVTLLTAAISALTVAYSQFNEAQNKGTLSELKGLPKIFSKLNLAESFTKAGKAIKDATTALAGGSGLTAAISALGTSALATVGVIGAIVAVGVGLVKLYDHINVTAEEQKELALAAGEEFQGTATEVENLNAQLQSTNEKIEELKSKGTLSLTDQRDLQNLEEQNRVLEAQIALQEAAKSAAEEKAVAEINAALKKGFSLKWEDVFPEKASSWTYDGFQEDIFSTQWNDMGFKEQIDALSQRIQEARRMRDEIVGLAENEGRNLTKSEQEEISKYEEQITSFTSALSEVQNEVVDYYNSLENATSEEGIQLRDDLAEIISYAAAAADPLGAVIDQIDEALNNLSDDELESLGESLQKLASDGKITADEIISLADTFPFLSSLMDEGGVSAQQLADYFMGVGEAANIIGSDIERLKGIIDPLSGMADAASEALKEFQEAAGEQDFDDVYDGYTNAMQQFFDDYNEGIRNSKTIWAAADLFFTPEQLEEVGYDVDEIADKMKDIAELFNGDPNNFVEKLEAMSEAGELLSDAGESLLEISGEEFTIPFENIDEVAEKFGVTEEAFSAMLRYWGMFQDDIIDIDLDSLEEYIEDMGLAVKSGEELVINVDELKSQLEEAGASGKTITEAMAMLEQKGYVLVSLKDNAKEVTDQMLELGYATEEAGKIKITMPDLQRLIDDLNLSKQDAEELVQKLWDTNNVTFENAKGEVLDLNGVLSALDQQGVENVTSAAQDAQKAVEDVTGAVLDLNNSKTNKVTNQIGGIGKKADEVANGGLKRLSDAINELNNTTISPNVNIPIPDFSTFIPQTTKSSDKKATGTSFANGGPTLLGDEQGVGPKPEMVIEGDEAFVAGQNGPEVVNLEPGAQVLTYAETKKALGGQTINGVIPARNGGIHGNFGHIDYGGSTVDPTKGTSGSSSKPSSGSSSSSSSKNYGSSSSSSSSNEKSYWEVQTEALEEYLDALDVAAEVIERSTIGSYDKQISYFKAAQDKIHATAEDFRKRGLNDTSKEIQELQLKWQDYADKIEDVYKSMYDDLEEMHADDLWEIEIQEKKWEQAGDRGPVDIAADNQKLISIYKRMQDEVHELANYYRSIGYDENSDYLQDLADAWWEYEEKIEEVYEYLTDALDNYIDASENKLKELERAGASVGERIAVYIERITRAQETLAALKFSNVDGRNDEAIADVQDQIWSDQDAIKDIQDSLWDELGNAIDVIFEEKQKEIDLIDKEIDKANKRIEEYQKQLDDILNDPSITGTDVGITDLLERLNDNLEAEKDALDAIVEPLENQINGYYQRDEDGNLEYIEGLTDKIEGYYKQDAEGNLIYVEGLRDQLEAENERYEQEKKEHDEQIELEKKQLAVQEAIKNLQQAQLDLETARKERPLYTLKDGVWAWRPDEEAIKNAQEAVDDAEQAKEDAENALKEYEEDLKHQQIIDGLQDQIDAIEKQKEQINKQIDLYEKESEARQKYIQSQIDYWEKEKEAYEKHYEELIEAQEDIIDAKEEERDALKEDLEKWKEEWEDITDSLKEPVRDIKDILNDIAKYGTPAMQDAVNDVTDLLEKLGHALEDFNPEFGGDNNWGDGDYMEDFRQKVIEKMKQNSIRWKVSDDEERERIEREQEELGNSIKATYDDSTGLWYDENGEVLYRPTDPDMVESIIAVMKENANAWGSASAEQKKKLEDMNKQLGSLIKAKYDDFTGKWYDQDGNPLFDTGGIASGLGVMRKATTADEVVLSPALSNLVLTPQKNREFAQFAQSMGLLFGTAHTFANAAFDRDIPVSNTSDNHSITINGVTIGESMLRRPLSDTLSLLGLHMNGF